ncbi:hypothetical protein LXA43DRAFT_1001334 [Ganoderma leucocontextum]|nr:hypothetical protein LXA43DRAFT_1001334 [Ganoderma leucocontextum]
MSEMPMPSGSASAIDFIPIPLTAEYAMDVAKEVVQSTPQILCEWSRCHTELNSWKSLQEHLHQHCQQQGLSSSSQGPWECKINRCAGRYHTTLADLQQHIDLSHLSRLNLPCPVMGCAKTFRSGSGLPEHLRVAHSDVLHPNHASGSNSIRPLRRPCPPRRGDLIALPSHPVPVYMLLCSTVRPAPRGKTPTASQASRRRWRRMDTQAAAARDDDEDELAIPLADLPPIDLRGCPVVRDYIVRPKLPESWKQTSRPQQVIQPPVPEKPPRPSIGYDAFAARFERLEQAGLMDGTGMWPEEGWDKEHQGSEEAKGPGGL